ncbi:MAG: molybdopterin-guanine dinucleotide biosynthesis protein B [Haloferacaceae archaeon]
MRVIGVVGESDAGKTTLVERVVPILGERGRVVTVKSIHHDIEIDEEGTDTHRHRTAGAGKVVGVTPSLTFSIEPGGKDDVGEERALDRVLRRLDREGFDYVLVEGFTDAAVPKIAVGDGRSVGTGEVVRRVPDAESVDLRAVVDDLDRLAAWSPGADR